MFRVLLNAEPAEGGNGGDPKPAPNEGLARLQKKHGDALAGLLYQKATGLQAEVDRLKGQVPKEGSRVLSADEAKTFDAFLALGKPDDLKAALSERDTLKADLSRRSRDDALRSAGYRPETLSKLLPADAAIEVKDGEKGRDGKPSKVATIAGADGKAVPLSEWIAANLAEFPAESFGGPDAKPAAPGRGAPLPPATRRDGPPPGRDEPSTPDLRAELRGRNSYAF